MVGTLFGITFILCHMVGDYVLQNNWIANRKTSDIRIAFLHGVLYTAPFGVLMLAIAPTRPPAGVWDYVWVVLIFVVTHAFIDRYRLVKPLIWAINQVAPREHRYPYAEAMANGGYSKSTPVWLSTWLMILVDNSIHIVIGLLAFILLLW